MSALETGVASYGDAADDTIRSVTESISNKGTPHDAIGDHRSAVTKLADSAENAQFALLLVAAMGTVGVSTVALYPAEACERSSCDTSYPLAGLGIGLAVASPTQGAFVGVVFHAIKVFARYLRFELSNDVASSNPST